MQNLNADAAGDPTAPAPSRQDGLTPASPRLRLAIGLVVVAALSTVSILARPSGSSAASPDLGPDSPPRMPLRHTPEFVLDTPDVTLIDAAGLAGHHAIPNAPARDRHGRPSLGTLVGSSHFLWIYAGIDQPRYTVLDLLGQVLASDLTATQVYEAFPELDIPGMEFGPDQPVGSPLMWAGGTDHD